MTQSKMDYINARFEELGISRLELAQEVLKEQTRHNPWMTLEDAYEAVEAVIRKREMQHALVTALTIDELADKKMLSEPMQSIIADDIHTYCTSMSFNEIFRYRQS